METIPEYDIVTLFLSSSRSSSSSSSSSSPISCMSNQVRFEEDVSSRTPPQTFASPSPHGPLPT